MRKRKVLRIGCRDSELSKKQFEEFVQLTRKHNLDVDFEPVFIKTYGDKHLEISLLDDYPPDFFTRELDEKLLNEEIDIALHSAKDVPYPLHRDLELYALTPSRDKRDALVSFNNKKLEELDSNSIIATSSKTRAENIKKIRDDIIIKGIRGDIKKRIAQIDGKNYHALVVAYCALERLGLEKLAVEIFDYETHDLQGNLAVIGKASRKDLKALFYSIDERVKYGKLFFIGAGIDSQKSISVVSSKILEIADKIYYDSLLDDRVLDSFNCEKVYVGKRCGKEHISQDDINRLIYKDIKKGLNVVRLKGGDLSIFSRLSEEIDFFRKRFIDFVLFPGITAYSELSAKLQVPFTSRDYSSKIVIQTASFSKSSKSKDKATHIFYMGGNKIEKIKEYLQKKEKDYNSLLIASNISYYNEKIEIKNLEEVNSIKIETPALIVAGEVVNYIKKTDRIIYTGLDYSVAYKYVAGDVYHYPLIKVKEIELDYKNFLNIKYDKVIFTSKTAVEIFIKNFGVFSLYGRDVISIGSETSKILNKYNKNSLFNIQTLKISNSDEMYNYIKDDSSIFLYPCSLLAKNRVLTLENVVKFPIYDIEFVNNAKIDLDSFDAIFFSSPSTVYSFKAIYNSIPNNMLIYVMGKFTQQALVDNFKREEGVINVSKI